MKKTVLFLVFLVFAVCCTAQTNDAEQPSVTAPTAPADGGSGSGLVPLAPPYLISTAPHFAVLVQFPRQDSIRRIALGDSNYFLAEADKDDPHYAIVKQIRASGPKANPPIETNMLVYMSSGRVVNIMLKAGKLADTAYSVDYSLPAPPPVKDPPPVSTEKATREHAQEELASKMLADVKDAPKDAPGITAGGLLLRYYRTERLNDLAFVSFDIANTTKAVIDLEGPQLNLVTAAEKNKDKKKGAPAKIEPIEMTQAVLSLKQLAPGERAVCLIVFAPPVHDSDQQVVLSVENRAMADQPVKYRVE